MSKMTDITHIAGYGRCPAQPGPIHGEITNQRSRSCTKPY